MNDGEVSFSPIGPHHLNAAQHASARAIDSTVELTVRVLADGQGDAPVPLSVQMSLTVADGLRAQLQQAVLDAAANARKA